MTLPHLLEAIEARLKANQEYVSEFQFARDKIELIGQTSALHMCLGERLSDLAKLLAIVKCMHSALEQISGDHPSFQCDDHTDCEWTARGALEAASKLAGEP